MAAPKTRARTRSGHAQNLMPFSARCLHQRQPRTAVGTAATAAMGSPIVAPSATVATAAAPATNPFRRESDTTSCRDLLIPTRCGFQTARAIPSFGLRYTA